MRRLILVLVVLAAGWAAPPAHAVLFGFNDGAVIDDVPDSREADVMANAGAQIHRFTLPWRGFETRRGHFDFARFDSVYQADLARGIQPLMTLAFAPRWAWGRHAHCATRLCPYPPDKRHLGDWRRAVRKVLLRYPRLAALEIWNEQNLSIFWAPYPNPKRYTRLLKAARRAARKVHSQVPILSGGLGNLPIEGQDANGIEAARFLRLMYRHGALGAYDGISLHPYPHQLDLSSTVEMLARVRDLEARHGDTAPLWVTEVGASTTDVTPAQQAQLLVRLLRTFASEADIHTVLVHTLFPPPGATGKPAGWAVVMANGRPRPAYCALAAERLRAPSSCWPALGLARDADQDARWDAQVALASALASALAYARDHDGDLEGFTPGGAGPAPSQEPGTRADPARIGVFRYGDADHRATVLCNASRADRSYCVMLLDGMLHFGGAAASVGETAQATLSGITRSW